MIHKLGWYDAFHQVPPPPPQSNVYIQIYSIYTHINSNFFLHQIAILMTMYCTNCNFEQVQKFNVHLFRFEKVGGHKSTTIIKSNTFHISLITVQCTTCWYTKHKYTYIMKQKQSYRKKSCTFIFNRVFFTLKSTCHMIIYVLILTFK